MLGLPGPRRLDRLPDAGAPAGPPSRGRLAAEALGVLQLPRLAVGAPWLATAPRGQGQTVFDLPGWRAPESSMAPLRTYLRALGYDARTWGLGTNHGSVERDAGRLVARLAADGPDAPPVALVGWSLGGVIAREVARTLPERVFAVVTFGSPIVGGPTHTVGASSYGAAESRRVSALAARRDRERPLRMPVTVIFTRRDGVVDWRACLDHTTPGVQHVEVSSTHLGLGVDPDVWLTVARALHAAATARPPEA